MELNSFLFPAPESSYTIHAAIGDLLFIPRTRPKPPYLAKKVPLLLEPLPESKHTKSQKLLLPEKGSLNECDQGSGNKGDTSNQEEENEATSYKPSVESDARIHEKIEALRREKISQHFKSQVNSQRRAQGVSEEEKEKPAIPCLYLPNAQGSSKLLVYFHGNAEDVGLASEMLDYIRSLLRVHVLAVEYPGYGIYDGSPEASQILTDAEQVYDFLTDTEQPWAVPENSILLFGRSIGTGPATHLAAHRNPGALLLMSPFKSIREIVKEQAGPLLQYVISDRFRNIDNITRVRCPTFIVHGQRDTLISFRHSQELHFACGGPSALIMPREMDHNEFDFIDDLIQPFHQFLAQCNITCEITKKARSQKMKGARESSNNMTSNANGHFKFPEFLFTPPIDFPKENTNSSLWNWILRKLM